MAQQLKRKKGKKRNGKIKFKQTARLVEKNEATRVARAYTTSYRKVKVRPPADVAPTFKIKIRKKR